MADFSSGYLVFKNVSTLGAAHSLASEMARLDSDVHLLDVGFLVKGAWVAAWVSEDSGNAHQKAAQLVQSHAMESVKVSAATLNSMYSLSPSIEATDTEALIVEADELALGAFFTFVETCLEQKWKLLEIRLRKSGPAGVHGFLVGPGRLDVTEPKASISVARTKLSGEYRRYF
ncbi:MAG: hypothetical protein J0L82_09600 [Deltaproteobacteria bacterium]|jgi:hypothetical protein|nr:hypothetical protein [Deltaproteobacteria bacterium]